MTNGNYKAVPLLVVRLPHLLNWFYRPDKRSPSWKAIIDLQKRLMLRVGE